WLCPVIAEPEHDMARHRPGCLMRQPFRQIGCRLRESYEDRVVVHCLDAKGLHGRLARIDRRRVRDDVEVVSVGRCNFWIQQPSPREYKIIRGDRCSVRPDMIAQTECPGLAVLRCLPMRGGTWYGGAVRSFSCEPDQTISDHIGIYIRRDVV